MKWCNTYMYAAKAASLRLYTHFISTINRTLSASHVTRGVSISPSSSDIEKFSVKWKRARWSFFQVMNGEWRNWRRARIASLKHICDVMSMYIIGSHSTRNEKKLSRIIVDACFHCRWLRRAQLDGKVCLIVVTKKIVFLQKWVWKKSLQNTDDDDKVSCHECLWQSHFSLSLCNNGVGVHSMQVVLRNA